MDSGTSDSYTMERPFICDGCRVRPPFEHRCHAGCCECELCNVECGQCGEVELERNASGWYFGSPHPSDGIIPVLCPDCRGEHIRCTSPAHHTNPTNCELVVPPDLERALRRDQSIVLPQRGAGRE